MRGGKKVTGTFDGLQWETWIRRIASFRHKLWKRLKKRQRERKRVWQKGCWGGWTILNCMLITFIWISFDFRAVKKKLPLLLRHCLAVFLSFLSILPLPSHGSFPIFMSCQTRCSLVAPLTIHAWQKEWQSVWWSSWWRWKMPVTDLIRQSEWVSDRQRRGSLLFTKSEADHRHHHHPDLQRNLVSGERDVLCSQSDQWSQLEAKTLETEKDSHPLTWLMSVWLVLRHPLSWFEHHRLLKSHVSSSSSSQVGSPLFAVVLSVTPAPSSSFYSFRCFSFTQSMTWLIPCHLRRKERQTHVYRIHSCIVCRTFLKGEEMEIALWQDRQKDRQTGRKYNPDCLSWVLTTETTDEEETGQDTSEKKIVIWEEFVSWVWPNASSSSASQTVIPGKKEWDATLREGWVQVFPRIKQRWYLLRPVWTQQTQREGQRDWQEKRRQQMMDIL